MKNLFARSIFAGGESGLVLKIFPEKRLSRKVQMIGDFLYTHARKFQKIFGFEYYIIIDPLSR